MMKALITQADHTAKVQDIPVPTIDDDEILVHTVALAQNPTDWKCTRNVLVYSPDYYLLHLLVIKRVTNAGTICGCDWSGYVVETGKSVTSLSVGDHVAGFVQGGTYTDRGAYAEYVKTPAELAWRVPDGTLSHEEAATMGCGFWTAVQALFHPTRLALVEPPAKVDKDEWILIYGGSGSVGMFAIQLAHLAGYKVVTTASPRNLELCKSLGADAVFDYNDPDVVNQIKEATNDSLHKALDANSLESSQRITVQSLAPGPGKVISILGVHEQVAELRDDVKIQPTLIYTSLGRAFSNRPACPEDRSHMAEFLKKVPGLVSELRRKEALLITTYRLAKFITRAPVHPSITAMSPDIPKTMKALVTQADKTAKVQDIPVPTIDDDEVLVRTVALAQNPTDWKFIKNITNVGTICGCDWSGYVAQVGKNVSNPSVGDHVAGFVQGGTYTDRGAYAEYVKTPAELVWKVPDQTLSHEEAATMGCSFWTAAQALFHPTRLALVEPPAKVDKEEWVMIYGGSGKCLSFEEL
ncbi:hypothetical protein EW026_g4939 [Hermanssonia centrifuga]|uniref:Enoyl reductase (ER) domain-containing protein n=1 Tax=Hermanssonia centrifuga TaxID=98765 RepID=A0A4S4KGM0_9APHY|nr:hypothetical protein EW026_g4939 [Hermanssonia centrifuga]